MSVKELDWVAERAKCSLITVFEKLKAETEHDVEIRHAIPGERYRFEFAANGESFSACLALPNLQRHVVKFKLETKTIVVLFDDKPFLEGAVGLSDEGECKISVAGEELEFWQFRKRALEKLFFGF